MDCDGSSDGHRTSGGVEMKRWDIANNPSRHAMENIKKAWKQNNKRQKAYRCPETVDIEDLIAAKKKEQDQ